LPAICYKIENGHHLPGFCDDCKVCNQFDCFCLNNKADSQSAKTSSQIPVVTACPNTEEITENSIKIAMSNKVNCPWWIKKVS
jgi:hypothetical protein